MQTNAVLKIYFIYFFFPHCTCIFNLEISSWLNTGPETNMTYLISVDHNCFELIELITNVLLTSTHFQAFAQKQLT